MATESTDSVPKDFKEKLDEVLQMCDTPECFNYLQEQVSAKGEEYKESDEKGESSDEDDMSSEPDFSMDNAPSTD